MSLTFKNSGVYQVYVDTRFEDESVTFSAILKVDPEDHIEIELNQDLTNKVLVTDLVHYCEPDEWERTPLGATLNGEEYKEVPEKRRRVIARNCTTIEIPYPQTPENDTRIEVRELNPFGSMGKN